jgi:hypothetical protein
VVSPVPDVVESLIVAVPPSRVYELVGKVRPMARWSPECFAVWIYRRREGVPVRFVGFNRRGGFVWFTTCRVVVDEPDREFVFDVSAFGLPVSRWGYRFAPVPGGTEVTEFWIDRRGPGARTLGRIFTGPVAGRRGEANREGMRATLRRLRVELESAEP